MIGLRRAACFFFAVFFLPVEFFLSFVFLVVFFISRC